MGVVNVTPDSFSDGGRYLDPGAAVEHGRWLAAEGAQILDVGGESTRPGAEDVPAAEELRRVLPVVEGLAGAGPAGGGPARPRRSRSTPRRPRWRRPRSTRARASSTTSRPSAATRTSRGWSRAARFPAA